MRSILSALLLGSLLVACSPDRSLPGVAGADEITAPGASASRAAPTPKNASVYQFAPVSILGQPTPLSQYRGKKILIVNTASMCRYTPQYAELEQLWQQYGNHVTVLAFPCDQFGGQEFPSDSSINAFCTNNYNITFPLFSRIDVSGPNIDPLYAFLGNRLRNGFTNQRPTWNFCKYLINENGHVMAFYPSNVSPMSPTIIADVLR